MLLTSIRNCERRLMEGKRIQLGQEILLEQAGKAEDIFS